MPSRSRTPSRTSTLEPPARIDVDGWMRGVRRAPSPNRDDRPDANDISLIVVHGISLPPGCFGSPHIEALFANRLDPNEHPYFAEIAALRVSAHFVVRRDGALVQFVPCRERAWHAGASCWRGRERCNDFSIGIELEGADDVPYAPPQYPALASVIRAVALRYPIREVVGHSDIAPGRKTDPGPAFDWNRLRRSLQGSGLVVGADQDDG